uniref:Sulfotransferase family protein n=1 Tax=Marseillevirus LCMAC202 TaxID=2506606 RepID=A0A481YZ65_9VIRU|nr:MAG: hypothetical protein LCMAC202_04690 [Marseillevirus LCMAC202]
MNPNELSNQVIIIGHPCCGSSEIAKIFAAFDYDVRYEQWGKHGVASWTLAIDSKDLWDLNAVGGLRRPFHVENKRLIHHVRNPLQAIPDIIEEDRNKESYDYRKKILQKKYHINLDDYSALNRAAISFILWNQIIAEQEPGLVVHVENAVDPLRQYVREFLGWNFLKKVPEYQLRARIQDWSSLRSDVQSVLDDWCSAYNYPKLSESIGQSTVISQDDIISQVLKNTRPNPVMTNILGPRSRIPTTIPVQANRTKPLETEAPIRPRLVHKVVVQSQANADVTSRQRARLGIFSVRSKK